MTIFDTRDAILEASRNITRGPATDFGENFSAAFDAQIEGANVFSREINEFEQLGEIRERLRERGVAEGRLPEVRNPRQRPGPGSTIQSVREDFFARLRELSRDNPDLFDDIPLTREQADAQIAGEIREAEAEAADVGARATLGGLAGQFAGGAAGALADPVTLSTVALGAPFAAGIIRTAAIEAGIAAGTEIPLQVSVQRDRSDLGLDAGIDRAISNVALAAIGGGAFGGALRGVQAGVGRIQSRIDAARTDRQAQRLAEEAEQVRRQAPDDPDIQAAANTIAREQEFQSRNPFVEGVPGADRAFTRAVDAAVTSVSRDGISRRFEVDFPTRSEADTPSIDRRQIREQPAISAPPWRKHLAAAPSRD